MFEAFKNWKLLWPERIILEFLAFLVLGSLFIVILEKAGEAGIIPISRKEAELMAIPLWWALVVFWLSRWRSWTIWLTGTIAILASLVIILIAGALYTPAPILAPVVLLAVTAQAHLTARHIHRKAS